MGVSHLHHRQMARLRQIVVAAVLGLAIYCFLLAPEASLDGPRSTNPEAYRRQRQGQGAGEGRGRAALGPEVLNNRFMTEEQCRATFPGLLDQVDDEVAKGPFKLERITSRLGPLVARIRDGQLYILSATRKADLSRDMLAHRAATLHQIANALLTWPHPESSTSSSSSGTESPFSHIPDTIFAFNHHDDPQPSTFSYSRPADPALLVSSSSSSSGDSTPKPKRFFTIPHFSLYSWPLPFIGSLPQAARAIAAVESGVAFADKIPRAVWRGTTWFNNPRAGRLRQNLVRAFGTASGGDDDDYEKAAAVAARRAWADIESLDWGTASQQKEEEKGKGGGSGGTMAGSGERNASNALRIEDFCRYKYIVHTEGVTYSGRFQFHNLCESVVITPPVAWIQHVTHLLRPVFSYTLDVDAPDVDPDGDVDAGVSFKSKPATSRLSARSLFSSLPWSADRHTEGEEVEVGVETSETKIQPRKTPDTNAGPGLPRRPIDLGPREKPPALARYPAPWVREAWPTEHAASAANIVFVAPDWSDLEATVAWLAAHPRLAAGIARRQRALFHGGGYFTPAAETCYWRAMIRGWSEVVRVDEGAFDDLEGMTWEEFSLKEIHK